MGIGFAIPVNMVKGVVAAAKRGGTAVKRPWLGASLQNVTKEIADSIGLDRPVGALVADVAEGGPAAEAGLKRGDVITAIDGQPVEDSGGVGFRLGERPLGGVASLSVLRAGKTIDLSLRLVAAPEIPPRDAIRIKTRSPFEGAVVMNISPALIEEMSIENAHEGVIVAEVAEGSTAARRRLAEGRPHSGGQRREDRNDPRPRKSRRPAPEVLEAGDRARRRSDPDGVWRVGERTSGWRAFVGAGRGKGISAARHHRSAGSGEFTNTVCKIKARPMAASRGRGRSAVSAKYEIREY